MGDTAPRVAATSQVDLAVQMEHGKFRSDLYYRLAGVIVDVLTLRDRVDDIPLLAIISNQNRAAYMRHFSDEAMVKFDHILGQECAAIGKRRAQVKFYGP